MIGRVIDRIARVIAAAIAGLLIRITRWGARRYAASGFLVAVLFTAALIIRSHVGAYGAQLGAAFAFVLPFYAVIVVAAISVWAVRVRSITPARAPSVLEWDESEMDPIPAAPAEVVQLRPDVDSEPA